MLNIPPAMMTQDNRYLSAVGTVRVLEKRLMDKAALLRLLESKTGEELERTLGDFGFGEALAEVGSIHEFETFLRAELKKSYTILSKLINDKRPLTIFLRRYDFHNLKALLKAETLAEEAGPALTILGEIPIATLKDGLEGAYKKLPNELITAIKKVRHYLESNDDPQGIDLIVDREYARFSIEEADKLNIPFLKLLISIQTDINNLKTLMRIKKSSSPKKLLSAAILQGGHIDPKTWFRLYDRSTEEILTIVRRGPYYKMAESGGGEWLHKGDITELDRLADNFIRDYLHQANLTACGIEPIIAYLFYKENEIDTLRTILVGKLNGLPPETIKIQPKISRIFSVH